MIYREFNVKYGFISRSGLGEKFESHHTTKGRIITHLQRFLNEYNWVAGDKIRVEIEVVEVESR